MYGSEFQSHYTGTIEAKGKEDPDNSGGGKQRKKKKKSKDKTNIFEHFTKTEKGALEL